MHQVQLENLLVVAEEIIHHQLVVQKVARKVEKRLKTKYG